MNKSELLSKYESNLSGSKNKNHYLSYAKNFLDYADNLDKENIDGYIKKLKRQGKKAGTLNFAFRVIRRLFAVNGLEWPFRRGEAPQITQRDEYKPILHPEIIKIMVEAAKEGKLSDSEACFLALSVVYGLRREELYSIIPSDVDLINNTIFIRTVKGGRQRYHLIPPEIKPYIAAHDFNRKYSDTGMSQMFWAVVNHSGLEELKKHKLGWHAIRHSVDRELAKAGMDPFAVKAFLRFKGTSGELAMPERYYSGTVISLSGGKAITEEAKEDSEVFQKYHTLLEFWK